MLVCVLIPGIKNYIYLIPCVGTLVRVCLLLMRWCVGLRWCVDALVRFLFIAYYVHCSSQFS